MEKQSIELVLQRLLEEYQKDKNCDINEMIAGKLKEMGASDECLKEVEETLKIIDRFECRSSSLAQAKKVGKTRETWMREQLNASLEGFDEKVKVAALNAIEDAIENKKNEMLNQ